MTGFNHLERAGVAASARDLLLQARVQLIRSEPFFGYLALRMALEPSDDFPYMATDGKRVFYNPSRVLQGGLDDARFILKHEVVHIALGHHLRRQGRNSKLWNDACDYAANGLLVESGETLPEGGLYHPALTGKPAEGIYAWLLEQQRQDGQGGPQGGQGQGPQQGQGQPGQGPSGGPGQPGPGQGQPDPGAPPPREDFGMVLDAPTDAGGQAEVQALVKAAMAAGKKAGNLPGLLAEVFGPVVAPPTPWPALLQAYLTAVCRDGEDWSRFNRRYLDYDLYYPEIKSEAAGVLALAVDTSGSVNTALLERFMEEFRSISGEINYDLLVTLEADTKVNRVQQFLPGDPVSFKDVKGRGGTRFAPVFAKLRELRLVPDVLLYFTDMEAGDRPANPQYPVIWVAPASARHRPEAWKPPYGRVVYLD